MPSFAQGATWMIAGLCVVGVTVRPWRIPESVWAVSAAGALTAFGLIGPRDVLHGLGASVDVCLFLTGMMVLSETARREGLFDWVAGHAVGWSKGSPRRLFVLIYLVGVAVTAVLSNDATAVVLTPAVYAVSRRARVEALPYLFACAMVANAASFLLPVSNPANLVLFASRPPALADWLSRFALPSALAIGVTYLALRWRLGSWLGGRLDPDLEPATLSWQGMVAMAGIGVAVIVLGLVSGFGARLGAPTFAVGVATAAAVSLAGRTSPWRIAQGVSWSILPLVAGLFVVVEGLERSGVVEMLSHGLQATTLASGWAAPLAGTSLALAGNLTNNLPAGLVASAAVASAHPSTKVIDALLLGVDIGPNLSVTGSLATILWLTVVRREGEDVDFW